MAQKHLHELLREDQEPFLLKNYIADRRGQLKRPSPKTQLLQVKKRSRPISEVSSFPRNLCKNACFFSLQDSPDLRKSPLFEFSSPAVKSPCKSPNTIFLHIPNRTAALLVEAAMRIQKQSASSKPKTQSNKSHGFGLIGSFLNRLKTHRNRTQKREIEGNGVKVSVKDILRWDSSVGRRKVSTEETQLKMVEKIETCLGVDDHSACELSNSCETCFSSQCNGRPSSAGWSESNEDKSLDLDTSCSSQSDHYSEVVIDTDCVCCDKVFCESPFRFVLEQTTTPSAFGSRTPEFPSPATSPARHTQEKEGLKNFQVEEEEEDKEQCSPVSVLDPPFEDDDEVHDNEDEEDSFDMECSYAIIQRTKKQLLQKLRRFEKLAELDPIELEKRMLEDDDEEYNNFGDLEGESEECDDDYSETSESCREETLERLVREVLSNSNFPCMKRIPKDVKRLVSDLIVEEHREEDDDRESSEELVQRVCKRFESWKEVKSNTIDMMVEQDLRKELIGWKKNQDQVVEIEVTIFGLLVEELAVELVCLSGN